MIYLRNIWHYYQFVFGFIFAGRELIITKERNVKTTTDNNNPVTIGIITPNSLGGNKL